MSKLCDGGDGLCVRQAEADGRCDLHHPLARTPKHGDERRRHVDSTWNVRPGSYRTAAGATETTPVGSGLTTSVVERWCAKCEDWIRCAGPMGALNFEFEHEHGKDVRP